MKSASLYLLLSLAFCAAVAADPRTNRAGPKRQAKPPQPTPGGTLQKIPERPPEDPKEQYNWRLKWILKNRMNHLGIRVAMTEMEKRQTAAKEVHEKFKGAARPDRAKIAYASNIYKWYSQQLAILSQVLEKRRELRKLEYISDKKERADALAAKNDEILALLKELRELLNSKPAMPQSLRR